MWMEIHIVLGKNGGHMSTSSLGGRSIGVGRQAGRQVGRQAGRQVGRQASR